MGIDEMAYVFFTSYDSTYTWPLRVNKKTRKNGKKRWLCFFLCSVQLCLKTWPLLFGWWAKNGKIEMALESVLMSYDSKSHLAMVMVFLLLVSFLQVVLGSCWRGRRRAEAPPSTLLLAIRLLCYLSLLSWWWFRWLSVVLPYISIVWMTK